jgi:signal transduction histidine kinase
VQKRQDLSPRMGDAAQGLREVCHDMRQPVAGVLALAAAGLVDPDVPIPVRARLEQIVQQAEMLADMIQDLLHVAEPGKPSPGGNATSEAGLPIEAIDATSTETE